MSDKLDGIDLGVPSLVGDEDARGSDRIQEARESPVSLTVGLVGPRAAEAALAGAGIRP
jgi:hypothetical protein